jgi:hypothetical protein
MRKQDCQRFCTGGRIGAAEGSRGRAAALSLVMVMKCCPIMCSRIAESCCTKKPGFRYRVSYRSVPLARDGMHAYIECDDTLSGSSQLLSRGIQPHGYCIADVISNHACMSASA